MSTAMPVLDIHEETTIENVSPWKVVLHNDDVNTFTYVVKNLQIILKKPKEVCEKHTLEAHETGRSIVFSGSFDEAEQVAVQLHAALIMATLEKG